MCEQCHAEKDIELFRKVTNQYTGVHPMSICKECYKSNQEARQQKQAEEWEVQKAVLKEKQEECQKREERERRSEQEHLARQQALEAWYLQQPDRQCIDCKQVLAASAFGYSMLREIDGMWLPAPLHQRCRDCHEEYRVRGRPLCQMCYTRTQSGGFLREYEGYHLDIIRVCCENCIPQFEALSEWKQIDLLRRAMVTTYGETAVIYVVNTLRSGRIWPANME